jgi:hypothetical protein
VTAELRAVMVAGLAAAIANAYRASMVQEGAPSAGSLGARQSCGWEDRDGSRVGDQKVGLPVTTPTRPAA